MRFLKNPHLLVLLLFVGLLPAQEVVNRNGFQVVVCPEGAPFTEVARTPFNQSQTVEQLCGLEKTSDSLPELPIGFVEIFGPRPGHGTSTLTGSDLRFARVRWDEALSKFNGIVSVPEGYTIEDVANVRAATIKFGLGVPVFYIKLDAKITFDDQGRPQKSPNVMVAFPDLRDVIDFTASFAAASSLLNDPSYFIPGMQFRLNRAGIRLGPRCHPWYLTCQ